ncbi:MAG: O-antigen ligase family protein [Thermoanaerobaculia bacterium]
MAEPWPAPRPGAAVAAVGPGPAVGRAPKIPAASLLGFIAVNAGIGWLLLNRPLLATIHALATVGLGLYWAFTRRPDRVAYVAAYITGAEVLWRMTEADIYWEFGKYAVATIFLVSIARGRRWKGPGALAVYFLLLLPSALMTATQVPLSRLRVDLSFNLSGPLALAVTGWFFWRANISHEGLARLLTAYLAPVMAMSVVVASGVMENPHLAAAMTGSNPATSGGFAPNQVSALLGLGTFFAFLLILEERLGKMARLIFFVVLLILATQSALTFSRGGLYMAAGSAAVVVVFLLRSPRYRLGGLLVLAVCFFAAKYLIVPRLDELTGGAVVARFQDTGVTNRDEIARSDIEIFTRYPVLGVGPGMARAHRARTTGIGVSAHTEFTRLLAEHGVFGLASLLLLLVIGARAVLRAPTAQARAFSAGALCWGMLFMIINAMRLVAPAFVIGLAAAHLGVSRRPPPRRGPPASPEAVRAQNPSRNSTA